MNLLTKEKPSDLDGSSSSDLGFFTNMEINKMVNQNKNIHDQKRTMHPNKVNSDWLVIGRSLTNGNIKNNLKKLIKHLI